MASVLTTTQIVTEYGQYYVKEGQNRSRLFRALQQMPVTLEQHARHIRTTETKYRMANYKTGAVLQPFSTTFNPISNLEFVPNQIDLQKIKVNVRITPDEIEDMWLGFMSGNTTRNKKDWPIVRFLMEEYIAKQIGEDRENNMVYKGIRNDGGSTPGSCLDGIKKQLLDGVGKAEYPINVITGIGALDESSIFDQIEAFDEALPQIYRTQPVTIFVSPKWFRAFMKDRRSQTFYQLRNENDLDTAIDFTGGRHRLVALPSMEGTNDLWATVPNNLLWLTIRDMNTASADVQAIHYDVDIMLDWWEGLGFACNKEVWVSAETVGASAVDTASPADGIIARSIYPKVNAASGVDHEKATVKGSVLGELPEGTTVKVNYGTSTSLGTQSSALTADTKGVYTANLTSLSAETKYYYRLEVTIGTDKYVSETKDFTTGEAPAAGGAE
ncbi:MAG: fibronectin type III domain-containing protein [Bacteroidales bacterium]|nr:fibronectin type III domain-containing protein [Bacteroidales bacterium]